MHDETPPELSFNDLLWIILIVFSLMIIFLISRIFYSPYTHTNTDSARYLLSTLVQSEAAIVAIAISLSLVAMQLAVSLYSSRIMEIFKKNPLIWAFLLLYITA